MTRQHRCQHDSVSTLCHDQVAPAVTSSAWLSNDIASRPMLPRQHHHQHDLAATSHHGQVTSMIPRRHDSTATSRRCQHWLSNAVTSMTRGLGAYFLDHPSDSEVYYRSCSRAWGVPLQSKTWLGYTATNASWDNIVVEKGLIRTWSRWTIHRRRASRSFNVEEPYVIENDKWMFNLRNQAYYEELYITKCQYLFNQEMKWLGY
jgi:hypothetical protein